MFSHFAFFTVLHSTLYLLVCLYESHDVDETFQMIAILIIMYTTKVSERVSERTNDHCANVVITVKSAYLFKTEHLIDFYSVLKRFAQCLSERNQFGKYQHLYYNAFSLLINFLDLHFLCRTELKTNDVLLPFRRVCSVWFGVFSALVATHRCHRRRRCRAHQSMTLHKNRIAKIPLAQKCAVCSWRCEALHGTTAERGFFVQIITCLRLRHSYFKCFVLSIWRWMCRNCKFNWEFYCSFQWYGVRRARKCKTEMLVISQATNDGEALDCVCLYWMSTSVSTSFQPARSNIKICIEYLTSCNINSRWIDPLGSLWHGVSTVNESVSIT